MSNDEEKPEASTEQIPHEGNEEVMQKLNESEQKVNEHWDRILRLQAEMGNMVRRHERDIANAHKFALEKFALELLPIIDSLELCIKSAADSAKALIEGVQMTLKLFQIGLEKFGIESLEPLNQAFDPEFHKAISMIEDQTVEPNTVLTVLQKGYLLNGRLIRPALVIVAKSNEA